MSSFQNSTPELENLMHEAATTAAEVHRIFAKYAPATLEAMFEQGLNGDKELLAVCFKHVVALWGPARASSGIDLGARSMEVPVFEEEDPFGNAAKEFAKETGIQTEPRAAAKPKSE